ncbi:MULTISPECIES: alpha/beta hydrolase [unclassified Microbacterium]|uniref:alpha/beta hydrolase n=1 Tax=unclassified Microbacterium TaxID=2609290 RepID=UPI00386A2E07
MALDVSLDPDAVRWSASETDRPGRPLLVLLHGYGSHEEDLFGLAPHLPPAFVVASVRAPFAPRFPMPGHSWFAIDGVQSRDPAEVQASTDSVLTWLDAVRGDAPLVGMLGFSQGGVIALQALRTRPHDIDFVVNLSGYAFPEPHEGDESLAEVRPPVFWGRGARDGVITPPFVEHTALWLPDHVDLSGRVYAELAHAVSTDELDDVRVFLEKRLAKRKG